MFISRLFIPWKRYPFLPRCAPCGTRCSRGTRCSHRAWRSHCQSKTWTDDQALDDGQSRSRNRPSQTKTWRQRSSRGCGREQRPECATRKYFSGLLHAMTGSLRCLLFRHTPVSRHDCCNQTNSSLPVIRIVSKAIISHNQWSYSFKLESSSVAAAHAAGAADCQVQVYRIDVIGLASAETKVW